MKILSFDCAMKNMGVCFVEIDLEWKAKIKVIRDKLKFRMLECGNLLDDKLLIILRELNDLLNNVLVIKFMNVFDLIPECSIKGLTLLQSTERIKYFLHCMDSVIPKSSIDLVLIESQMIHNNITHTMSGQIMYHYIQPIDGTIRQKTKLKPKLKSKPTISQLIHITYSLSAYPIQNNTCQNNTCQNNTCQNNTNYPKVLIVGTGLKNKYATDVLGDYSNFILKYSNTTANKRHTTHNFLHFIKVFGLESKLKLVPNKLNDIADAFMMTVGWLKKECLI